MHILSKLAASGDCFWCGETLLDDVPGSVPRGTDGFRKRRTRDHLISRRDGGTFIVWSCPICNELKGSMNPIDFREKFRPDVSEELFEAALAEARRKRICPRVAGRRKKAKRKKKLPLKMEKLAEYYDGVYVTGYSSKDPLKRKPSLSLSGRGFT